MIIRARIVRIEGENIDTDVLYPGPYLNIEEPERMKDYLFEGLDPSLRTKLVGDTALVVDNNFGCGSSREHVPRAMKASGVRCVIGRSFARIFYRNCINLGLLAVSAPDLIDQAVDGHELVIDTDAQQATIAGGAFGLRGLPPFILETMRAGGFVEWAREHPPAPGGSPS